MPCPMCSALSISVLMYFRRGHGVLKLALPEKEEYVLLVRMSPIQRQLYREFMGIVEDGFSEVTNNNPLKAFAVCCKVSTLSCLCHLSYNRDRCIGDELHLAGRDACSVSVWLMVTDLRRQANVHRGHLIYTRVKYHSNMIYYI